MKRSLWIAEISPDADEEGAAPVLGHAVVGGVEDLVVDVVGDVGGLEALTHAAHELALEVLLDAVDVLGDECTRLQHQDGLLHAAVELVSVVVWALGAGLGEALAGKATQHEVGAAKLCDVGLKVC